MVPPWGLGPIPRLEAEMCVSECEYECNIVDLCLLCR
jgi:hypothetical protein